MKKIFSFLSFLLFFFVSCTPSNTSPLSNNQPNIEYAISANGNLFNQEFVQNITLPERWSPIPKAKIDCHSNLLVGRMLSDEATLALFNLHSNEIIEIDARDSSLFFGVAYEDDDKLIYYIYNTFSSILVPQEYILYDKRNAIKEVIINIKEMSDITKSNYITPKISTYDNKYFLEINSERETVSGNDVVDKGIRIFQYDTVDKTLMEVATGMSPYVTADGDLYYLKMVKGQVNGDLYKKNLANDTNQKEILIEKKVSEYVIKDDKIIFLQYDHEGNKSIWLHQDDESSLIYMGEDFRFWDLEFDGNFISWQQTESPLYIYDLSSNNFIFLSELNGARFAEISECYLYWFSSEYVGPEKNDSVVTIHFIDKIDFFS